MLPLFKNKYKWTEGIPNQQTMYFLYWHPDRNELKKWVGDHRNISKRLDNWSVFKQMLYTCNSK